MWPDTSFKAVDLNSTNMNSEMTVTHPGTSGQTVAPITSNSQVLRQQKSVMNSGTRISIPSFLLACLVRAIYAQCHRYLL